MAMGSSSPPAFSQVLFRIPLTMARPYLGLRGNALMRFMIVGVVCPAYMLLGYNNAVFGGLLDLPSFVQTFPRIDTANTKGEVKADAARVQGTVVALYTVGCMFGSLSCLRIGDRLGRIRTIAAGCIVTAIGSIIQCSSFSLAQLIVGRLVAGYGFGIITATVPVWQAEASPAQHRGALVVLEGAFASIGLSLSQWVDLGLFFTKSSVSWRFPVAFPIVLSLIIMSVLPFVPDSARWLVRNDRIQEARTIMAILEDAPDDDPVVLEDIRKMEASLAETGKSSLLGLFKPNSERLLNRALLAMFSTFSQQMNGIGVIGFYTTTIYTELLGLSAITARVLSGSTYAFQLICTLVAFHTIDRLGRRQLMLFGTTGMGTMFVIVAGTVSNAENSRACAGIAAACVFMITLFFGVGALGINYLYGTEVAPLAYRVPIYALTTTTLWSFNFMVVEVTPVGFANIGFRFFIIFAVLNLCLLTPVVYFFFPETRGRSLEDMDAIFITAKNALDVPKVATRMPHLSILSVGNNEEKQQTEISEKAAL